MYATLTIVLLLWKQVYSIRIVDLQVPGHAEEGGSALLGCTFDLEGEELYSVKWYKDGKEFYRYVPSNNEPISNFPVSGITVDLFRSSSSVVALEQLKRESAGLYKCEVSGEAPYFVTQFEEKNINIHLLPTGEPRVTGLQNEYQIGETLRVNCSSGRSRPRAVIKWLVNERAAQARLQRGPWERRTRERPDARDTVLGLAFTLTPEHFKHGILNLKCQSTVAPLYHKEVAYHVMQAREPEAIDALGDFEKLHSYENAFDNDSFDSIFTMKPDINLVAYDHGSTLELSVRALLLPCAILQFVSS